MDRRVGSRGQRANVNQSGGVPDPGWNCKKRELVVKERVCVCQRRERRLEKEQENKR